MSLLFSRSCEYGIQATIFIALQPNDNLVSIKDISKKLNIPSPYLAKILQSLSKRGVLHSVKGPNGGFKLSRSKELITLKNVVDSIDGLHGFDKCILGFEKCGAEENLCPVHEYWTEIKAKIINSMLTKSIGELNENLQQRAPALVKSLFY
jgi:Rrf2 family iron-sulfur cluster assembly transcriptional regulator